MTTIEMTQEEWEAFKEIREDHYLRVMKLAEGWEEQAGRWREACRSRDVLIILLVLSNLAFVVLLLLLTVLLVKNS